MYFKACITLCFVFCLGQGSLLSQPLPPTNLACSDEFSDIEMSWTNDGARYDEFRIYGNGVLLETISDGTVESHLLDVDGFDAILGLVIELEAWWMSAPLPRQSCSLVGVSVVFCPTINLVTSSCMPLVGLCPSDPLFPNQWSLHNTGQAGGKRDADIDAPQAWAIETGDPSVIIGVVDFGVDWDHPELWDWTTGTGNLLPGVDFSSATVCSLAVHDPDPPVEGSMATMDIAPTSHGTVIAGQLVAAMNNGQGITGIAPGCRVMPMQITGVSSLEAAIPEAIRCAAEAGARVITIQQFEAPDGMTGSAWDAAICEAYDTHGALIFASAGANGCTLADETSPEGSLVWLANHPKIVAVSSLDRHDELQVGTSCGLNVEIAAPGSQIMSTSRVGLGDPELGLDYRSDNCGTSFAAPTAAGVAALLFSYDPTLTNDEVRQYLIETADDLGDPGRFGAGRVNAYRALLRAATGHVITPGDVNNDQMIDVGDMVYLLEHLFNGGPAPQPLPCVGDTNGDNSLDTADVITISDYLYLNGPEPVAEDCL